MKIISAIAVLMLHQAAAFAAGADAFELKSATLTTIDPTYNVKELALSFQDKNPVSGVCPLTVSRFEFIDAVKTLMVNLTPAAFCIREDFGVRSGLIKWNLPSTLYLSSTLQLVLNDKHVGQIMILNGQIVTKAKQ